MCVPLTEVQFMLLKIANNVIHCVTHAVQFGVSVIYILFGQRCLKLIWKQDVHIFSFVFKCVYTVITISNKQTQASQKQTHFVAGETIHFLRRICNKQKANLWKNRSTIKYTLFVISFKFVMLHCCIQFVFMWQAGQSSQWLRVYFYKATITLKTMGWIGKPLWMMLLFWFGHVSAPFFLWNQWQNTLLFIFFFSLFSLSVMWAVTYYSWGVVPLPSKASTVSPKLLPSWAIYSFGYLSVIAPLWSLREANHLLWPRGSNGHRASDPLPVRERRRDRERPAPIRRRNNMARAAQFHLPFHPILWKLFINNSFLSHTGAPGEGRRGGREVGEGGGVMVMVAWEDIGSRGGEEGGGGACPPVDVCWILTHSHAHTRTHTHTHLHARTHTCTHTHIINSDRSRRHWENSLPPFPLPHGSHC